jgi:hypothetical protein
VVHPFREDMILHCPPDKTWKALKHRCVSQSKPSSSVVIDLKPLGFLSLILQATEQGTLPPTHAVSVRRLFCTVAPKSLS